ncbi:hypothetical protein JQC67_13355 [Aurantibacter crassamenti]|uniref:MORN repeat-containing protein n=1 Tax=Aurantibacter crassamenti TaxID=1837375 RepID=UPI0019399ABC|nr:hypothetical protein [Aurantibacter crassamenti]MBM1107134.1 hypothetical protein [Aurantibacter crassamenti]
MKKRIAIPYILFAATAGVALFYLFRSVGLKNDLKQKETQQAEIDQSLAEFKEVMRIDSILLEGDYKKALNAYNSELKYVKDNPYRIPLRIGLAEQLLDLKSDNTEVIKDSVVTNLDSLQLLEQKVKYDLNVRDSLTFALEKTKVQLATMRRQLSNKSLGEYLKFKNKKGSLMHYVGQVSNNMANGTGVAILNTGSRYEGSWKNNERHGEGTFYWADGEYYVGSYSNDLRNGIGTYYWPNKEKYVGEWKDDKRNGKGTFYGKDGEVFTKGLWKNDKLVEEEK